MSLTRHSLLGRMTAAERAAGRYLRAPDGHDGDDPPADPPADPPPADDHPADPPPADDPPADPAKEEPGERSLMDGGDKKDEPDPATLPPEKYELKAPEGFAIDEALLGEADPVFRELGLSNDQANQLMPLVPKFAEALVTAQNDAHRAMTADWAKSSKADKEIGGANWAETENLVAKALDRFVGPAVTKDDKGNDVPNAFRQLLNDTGLGNHPEMIRAWRKIGAELGEGEFARSDAGAAVKQDRTAILYPEDVPNKEPA